MLWLHSAAATTRRKTVATVAQRLQSERLKYPGMLPDEIIIFREWLKLHEQAYDRFDYNVRIGQGIDPGPSFSPEVRRDAILITQLRLDAVAWQGTGGRELPDTTDSPAQVYAVAPNAVATIIEVKRNAGPANVGQLVTYDSVWIRDNAAARPPKLMLVVSAFRQNILPAVQRFGIDLQVVKADFGELRTPPRST